MDEQRQKILQANWLEVKEQITKACWQAGRNPERVTLIAVSKKHEAKDVAYLAKLGQRDFGENYVQEALAKQEELQGLDLVWHFIGSLQTNKVKFVVGRFKFIQSVDRIKLAKAIESKAAQLGIVQSILLQVNVGLEPQKAGVLPNEAKPLAEQILALNHVKLRGLMTLPPFTDKETEQRKYFALLRRLRDQLEKELAVELPELSMGMSSDFKVAIAEGATMVRIGTSIFGPRT